MGWAGRLRSRTAVGHREALPALFRRHKRACVRCHLGEDPFACARRPCFALLPKARAAHEVMLADLDGASRERRAEALEVQRGGAVQAPRALLAPSALATRVAAAVG